MSSNYQQKKMMNALGAIDTKGNIVLEQFQEGTALLFQPGNAQPFCVATDYDRATASWSYGKYFSDLGCAHEAADLRSSRTPTSDGSRRISGKSSKRRISHRQNSIGAPSRMTVLLMTEIPFRIKILIHGCNMNFQMYGLQIA